MVVIVWLRTDGFPEKVRGHFASIEEARSNLTVRGYKIEPDGRVGYGAPDEGLCYKFRGDEYEKGVAYIREVEKL
jgi:hypothetical protein